MNFGAILDGVIFGAIAIALAGLLGWIQNRGVAKGRALERKERVEFEERLRDVRDETERLRAEAHRAINEEHTPTIDEVQRDETAPKTPAVVARLLARFRAAKEQKP